MIVMMNRLPTLWNCLPDHALGDWLENHPDISLDTPSASFNVPAGEYRDAGGVRFSCPADGADCELTVMGWLLRVRGQLDWWQSQRGE